MVAAYKPAHWNDIPNGLKDPHGYWVTIHSGTMGIMVNVDALRASRAQVLGRPAQAGIQGPDRLPDPASAFVGYVGAVAINQAMGGTLDDFSPAIGYFKNLQKNQPIVPKQTSYARLISGEIPILLGYDFDAYRAKYKDHANVAFVIPKEGTVTVPYVVSAGEQRPHQAEAKKVLDFVLSDQGQAIWANALRPVRASAMSKEAEARFLPAAEYARAKSVDYGKMAEAQRSSASATWLKCAKCGPQEQA
jgi:putative spermidine/putrescine transport system substrate-binding protein